MEIALDANMPTYSGGLGMLAGDTLRSAADLGAPLAAVTLVYRKGYFRQHLDPGGNQTEEAQQWDPERTLTEVAGRVSIEIEQRPVWIRAWQYDVLGIDGDIVPVYLLDTNLPENSEWDRELTDSLYGGDERYRLAQEIVLGIGGFQMLRKLGHDRIQAYHMNEGHSALLALGLLERRLHLLRGVQPAGDSTSMASAACASSPRIRRCPRGTINFPSRWSNRCSATSACTCLRRRKPCTVMR